MDNTPSVVYGLEYQVCQHRFAAKHARRLLASSPFSQTRALSAVAGETDAVQFLVGTQTLRSDNQVGARPCWHSSHWHPV